MLGHAGVADSVTLQQRTVDEGIFGVNMEDAAAKAVNVSDWIDKLTDQMAGIPLDTEVLAFGFVEEPLPQCRLPKHVIVHDGKMIWALRTMLEGDAHAQLLCKPRQRLPKTEQLRHVVLEWLVNRVSAPLE